MKEAEGDARVEIEQADHGRWKWRYVGEDVVLHSHRTYASHGEAEESARIAYPKTHVLTEHQRAAADVPDSRRPELRAFPLAIALLLIVVVLWRARRGRARS